MKPKVIHSRIFCKPNFSIFISFCLYLLTTNSINAFQGELEIRLANFKSDTIETISFSHPIGAVALKIYEGDFQRASIQVLGKTFLLSQNNDSEKDQGFKVSTLIVLPSISSSITLAKGSMSGRIEVHGFFPDTLQMPQHAARLEYNPCAEPYAVPPKQWRAGLPAPIKVPDSTQVEHLIVHHSAFDVQDTNYTAAVRYIYTYHTQSNGWDDIGYNFLIAPDGTIFQGRDNFNLFDKDNVKGAHYCGKNSNTMGICLLGNFMISKPTMAALHSLKLLTTWKLLKENLSVYGNSIHPKGGTSTLPNIAGHRDSCYTKTECPGDFVYDKFTEIRAATDSLKNLCLLTNVQSGIQFEYIELFPSPAKEELSLVAEAGRNSSFLISDLQGRPVFSGVFVDGKASVEKVPAGIYFIKIPTEIGFMFSRFVKL